ncbi:hypothetical protein QJQ45_028744, partial [Haematococcus lacustris]
TTPTKAAPPGPIESTYKNSLPGANPATTTSSSTSNSSRRPRVTRARDLSPTNPLALRLLTNTPPPRRLSQPGSASFQMAAGEDRGACMLLPLCSHGLSAASSSVWSTNEVPQLNQLNQLTVPLAIEGQARLQGNSPAQGTLPRPVGSKYALAMGAALARSLPADPMIKTVTQSGLLTSHAGEAAAALSHEVQRFRAGLQGVLAQCLGRMGYGASKAMAMARGDHADCTDVEARVLEELRKHTSRLVALYARSLGATQPYTDTGSHADKGTKAAAAAAAAEEVVSGATGVGAACAPAAAVALALRIHLDSGSRLVERFDRQLQASACQLWALMHILQPHPSREVKEGLAQYTGRNVKQITDWFTNWRARHWKKIIKALGQSEPGVSGA